MQDLKDQYGISSDDKSLETKYPTFSGEQTDKLDYYSFREDWDLCVALKGPSQAEQLRILTHQSLTGIARAACRHMDVIWTRLKKSSYISRNATVMSQICSINV